MSMKYSSDTDRNRTCGFRLVAQYLNQLQHHATHDHQYGTVLTTYDVSGRKKEVGVNQKCSVATLYKSRNVPSVLFTNPEMSHRYINILRLCSYLKSLERPSDCVKN